MATDGQQRIVVKNTFIDLEDNLGDLDLAPPSMERAATAPVYSSCLAGGGAEEVDSGDDSLAAPCNARVKTEDRWEDPAAWSTWATDEHEDRMYPTQGGAMDPYMYCGQQMVMIPILIPVPVVEQPVMPMPYTVPDDSDLPPPPPPAPALQRIFSVASRCYRITWTIDGKKKLRSSDRNAVSPPFQLSLGGTSGDIPFKLLINAKSITDARGGGSFKKAKGTGNVQLKCEAELTTGLQPIRFRIAVGPPGSSAQEVRGPFVHDFAACPMFSLSADREDWDFTAAQDEATETFAVCVEFQVSDPVGDAP